MATKARFLRAADNSRPYKSHRYDVFGLKIGRPLTLFGSNPLNAWILLEADPTIISYCELGDLMPLAESKAIDIGVLEDAEAGLRVSELDLYTLVKNLVDNAIRYTPYGGRVDLSVLCDRGHVLLKVEDTGPGIPSAECERVFDPFYRVLGNHEMGSGLGLPIVRTIADRIGAAIRLENIDGPPRGGLRVVVDFGIGGKPVSELARKREP